MKDQQRLRLHLLDERRSIDIGRASTLIDRLADLREVEGDLPAWTVVYETGDATRAMDTCARDLDRLDPAWVEFIDFHVSRVARERSVGRPRP